MTLVIKTRGAGGLILADFRCPEHGVFEATVPRNESDAAPCPTRVSIPADGFYPSGGERACGISSPWTPSPVHGRLKLGDVEKGSFEPPPSPGALDTRALADGMPLHEWKKKRAEQRRDRTLRAVREKTR